MLYRFKTDALGLYYLEQTKTKNDEDLRKSNVHFVLSVYE